MGADPLPGFEPDRVSCCGRKEVTCVDGSMVRNIDGSYKLRTQNVKPSDDKSLIKTINDKNKLYSRPYSFTPQGVVPEKLFGVSNEEMDLSKRTGCLNRVLTLLSVKVPHSSTVQARIRGECDNYNSQTVLRRLVYDKRAVRVRVDTSNSKALVIEPRGPNFEQGKLKILLKYQRTTCPNLQKRGSDVIGRSAILVS